MLAIVGEAAISSVQNKKYSFFSLFEQSVIITERKPHTLNRIHACFQFRSEFLDLHCQLEVRNVGNVVTAFHVTELVSVATVPFNGSSIWNHFSRFGSIFCGSPLCFILMATSHNHRLIP